MTTNTALERPGTTSGVVEVRNRYLDDPRLIIPLAELAKPFGVTRQYLAKLAREGKLGNAARRLGRIWVVPIGWVLWLTTWAPPAADTAPAWVPPAFQPQALVA